MAGTYPKATRLKGIPARASGRFKASMENAALVGPGSVTVRFAKIQWIAILWRYLVLGEVLIMATACPSCFPVENALIVLGLGLAHTLAFSLLRARTSLTRTWPFYFADFAISMALMILAQDGTLIIVMSFYATTALFVRPMIRFSQASALSGLAAVSFLASMYIAAPVHYSTANIVNYSVVFFFWGFAWVLTCRLIERTAMLEINIYLEEQRRSFRRRLHDDLGNTLCGLHFKIQSLFRLDRRAAEPALALLEAGYERAGRVLDRILAGIEDEDGYDSIEELGQMAERDFGIHVNLSGNTGAECLSHAMKQEVYSLLREAIANTAKHAGVGEVTISVSRCRRRLQITVSDKGTGFEVPSIDGSQHDGGLGLRNMRERAEAIGAQLEVTSQPGTGTDVIISLLESEANDRRSSRLTSRLIESDTYLLLVRLKLTVLFLEILQFILGGRDLWSNPAAILVIFLVAIEAMTWHLFRKRLLAFFTRRPWWLVPDVLLFCLLYFISWQADIPVLVAEAASMAIILTAWFLGPSRNFALAIIMGAGMIFASMLAPPGNSAGVMRSQQLFIEVMDNLILAVLAGFACEFIRSINSLRTEVVDIALERHRASLSAETHRSLHQLVESLKHDIGDPHIRDGEAPTGVFYARFITSLETQSNLLKKRLRNILEAIDKPDSRMTGATISSPKPGDPGHRQHYP